MDMTLRGEWAEILVQVGHEARQTPDVAALLYVIANETYRLTPYTQAILLKASLDGKLTVVAASGVAVVERTAPHVAWVERMAGVIAAAEDADRIHVIDQGMLAPEEREQWAEYGAPNILWTPLIRPDGGVLGVLLLARERPWSVEEQSALELLVEAYAETWCRFSPTRLLPGGLHLPRRRKLALIASAIILALFPVRNSVLSPARIVPKDFDVVAAPMKGVIKNVVVHPDQSVAANDVLFVYDDTELRGKYAVSEREVNVADAALLKAQTEGIRDPKSNAETAQLTSVADLRKAELDAAAELYARVEVRAPRTGLVVMTDPENWVGRPVETGEHVLDVANPAVVEARLSLPVNDAIEVLPGASVDIYMNDDPVRSLQATVIRTNYSPEETPDGKLVFRISADFLKDVPQPKIGFQGTARIKTGRIPLAIYLLRRPLGIVRQYLSVVL
ncbi:MAG: HlyD family efflux transporter periplasmic adaptor subunit [Rhodospirillaceae bacterium]|nr:MAG: HlyD family efflux transporter periplasmic adaptor subunit [Rhodospirillaceae bacterium]